MATNWNMPAQITGAIERAGFDVTAKHWLQYDDSDFRSMLAVDDREHLLDGVRPVVITAVKRQPRKDST
jgi:hypothetical protein